MLRKEDTSVQNVGLTPSPRVRLERLFPPVEESCTILLSCLRGDYSASRIARAVEDCDAHLLNLNVTSDSEEADNRIVAELRVSHRNPESVCRSLERYGYAVIDADGAPLPDDSLLRSRYDELMLYLNL
ncbi:MAG: hypothetical protein NC212_02815 [Staphylococcus sp.]|nr:hypothetical protein [Staphylococcus sp.]